MITSPPIYQWPNSFRLRRPSYPHRGPSSSQKGQVTRIEVPLRNASRAVRAMATRRVLSRQRRAGLLPDFSFKVRAAHLRQRCGSLTLHMRPKGPICWLLVHCMHGDGWWQSFGPLSTPTRCTASQRHSLGLGCTAKPLWTGSPSHGSKDRWHGRRFISCMQPAGRESFCAASVVCWCKMRARTHLMSDWQPVCIARVVRIPLKRVSQELF